MSTAKSIYFWMVFNFAFMAAPAAHADVVNYTLDHVTLAGGEQITGTFDWTFSVGDFEGGSGEFIALEIPYTIYSFADGNLNIDIQTNSIEISGNGNYHDVGLDISLFLSQPFTPTQSAPIDLGLSFFECCGNGFQDQPFQSGSIVPRATPDPSCDFSGDGNCDIDDMDALIMEIAATTNAPMFDLNGDATVDLDDRNEWLAQAGAMNLPSETPYLLADFNLDGAVDGQDFLLWNEFKFTSTAKWSMGDANADGVTDGQDFLDWNANKFTSSAGFSAVPEPGSGVISFVALVLLGIVGLRR